MPYCAFANGFDRRNRALQQSLGSWFGSDSPKQRRGLEDSLITQRVVVANTRL